MKSKQYSAALLLGTALGLLGASLAAGSAQAGSAGVPCGTFNAVFNGSGYSGPGAAIAAGLDQTLAGPFVLGMQSTEYPAGALNPAIKEPVCAIGVAISSNGNPAQSYNNMVVMMPETDANGVHWNGRFLGTGNGGFAGALIGQNGQPSGAVQSVVLGVAEGYAAATTDLGTATLFNCNSLFCGSKEAVALYPNQKPGGLYGDDAAIEDFGFAATHEMTQAAKSLITTFYGQAPRYNYFHGCSTGGQQALMEAERFPLDYDGILAGSPAYNRTHLHIGSAASYRATRFAPDALLTPAALGLAHASMLSACVGGKDGGLSTDDWLEQPARCGFDAATLVCGTNTAPGNVTCDPSAGNSPCSCLTQDQATAMDAAWTGAQDTLGRTLFPGYERGTEEPAAATGGILLQESLTEPAFDSLDYWAFGPDFDWTTLFPSSTSLQMKFGMINALDNTPVGSSTFAGVLNANETNLSPFAANGGKLIMYAGYADPLIPTASAIDYYNKASVKNAGASNFLRMFLAPGMWHCSGGPGPNVFGNFNLPPVPTAPGDDILGALVTWRESNLLSDSIVATKYVNDDSSQGIAFQRPLCAYPEVSYYKKGDPTQVTSWVCKMRGRVNNQPFNPLYGPYYTPSSP